MTNLGEDRLWRNDEHALDDDDVSIGKWMFLLDDENVQVEIGVIVAYARLLTCFSHVSSLLFLCLDS